MQPWASFTDCKLDQYISILKPKSGVNAKRGSIIPFIFFLCLASTPGFEYVHMRQICCICRNQCAYCQSNPIQMNGNDSVAINFSSKYATCEYTLCLTNTDAKY